MNKDEALKLALAFIERVNCDGWILDSFEPEMYAALDAIKEALAKEWASLTDEEIKDIVGRGDPGGIGLYTREMFKKIEAKLKEKNGG